MNDLEGMIPEEQENIIFEYKNALTDNSIPDKPFEVEDNGNIII
jgi:hypothetical protein